MAISGQQVINVGLPNESAGSDSLYTAFNKAKTNFTTLFACASPYNTFNTGFGISANANPNTGVLELHNTGVTSIVAGTNIIVSQANGNVTISSVGGNGNGGGTVTSIGVLSGTLSISGSPIVSSGNITVELPTIANVAGSYVYPAVSVDVYGRITSIANGASVGTVTSVAVSPGAGISVTGSPITSTGTITVTNTGVTRISAGSGISVSGSNGNVTVSAIPPSGIVTSVGVSSNALVIGGSPVTGAGVISVDLPNTITTGNILANSTGGLGYTTGAGGTIPQTSSRTSGVTINKLTGAITLVSAAGSASYQTFTVTNSTVAATDVVVVNQKSGTDKYIISVTAVAAGSFDITFATTGGTTTEQPVFSFAVLKGAVS